MHASIHPRGFHRQCGTRVRNNNFFSAIRIPKLDGPLAILVSKTLRRFVDDTGDRLSEAKPGFGHFFLEEFVHGSLSVSLCNDIMRAATNLILKEEDFV